MTIFATTFIALAVCRCIEEFIRFCINYISNLRWNKKPKEVTVSEYKRISANVSPELHAMIKAHAQMLNLTITDYILIAINDKLKRT
jgi:hypothetical protein